MALSSPAAACGLPLKELLGGDPGAMSCHASFVKPCHKCLQWIQYDVPGVSAPQKYTDVRLYLPA
jgi:hypothetical protein